MFAFCLLDAQRGTAWLCRDRIGMKPLYVYRPGRGGLLFASEVRALLAAGPELVPPRLRRAALESFLAQGAVMSDAAVIEGISMLEPGTSLLCDFSGNVRQSTRYWSVEFGSQEGAELRPADASAPPPPKPTPSGGPWRSELVSNLAWSLRRSVSGQLLADVPVGLFLSSGIDSSAIATIASEVTAQELHTLSVGFDIAELDETNAAGRTAQDLGTRHDRILISGASVVASFDDVLRAADQPTVDGFNTFYVARAAREAGLTVALSGVGGDELFGGYRSFRDVPRAMLVRRLLEAGSPSAAKAAAGLLDIAAGTPLFSRRGRALAKLGESFRRPLDLVELYLLRRELFTPTERRALHPLPAESDALSGLERELVSKLKRTHTSLEPLDRIGELEFSLYMRHMLLRDSDVFGMANALEIRLPLLEHYVVAEAASARAAWRRPDPRPKPLLVDAAGERLPARSWQAPKRGFTFPWRAWLRGPLSERASAGLRSDALGNAGFDLGAVAAIWQAFQRGDPRVNELEIIALLVLEAYVREQRISA
jgi:asparagine synthase (glutamine-hydrolysing)